MARIRTMKPEFWQDEKLAPLAPIHRLVFLGLISHADDAGRLVDNIKLLDGLLFPETEDTARESLEILCGIGCIDRGYAESGQGVIQIVNWKHQKIDKPNLAAANDPIAFVDPSTTRRRYVPEKLRMVICARDEWICRECGKEVRLKSDRGPDLAEVDHIVASADGGDNSLENLQLLCCTCYKKKAIRRRIDDASAKDRRHVDDTSTLHICTSISTCTNHLGSVPPWVHTVFENWKQKRTLGSKTNVQECLKTLHDLHRIDKKSPETIAAVCDFILDNKPAKFIRSPRKLRELNRAGDQQTFEMYEFEFDERKSEQKTNAKGQMSLEERVAQSRRKEST